MIFSAAQLVKYSCKQLKYTRDNKLEKGKPNFKTGSQTKGNAWATKQVTGLPEMQSFYNMDDHRIYFTIDEIRKKKKSVHFIEYKSLQFEDNGGHYFNKSLIQAGFYLSLTKASQKNYSTAKFFKGKKNTIEINLPIKFYLIFGKKKYLIKIKNSKKILDFFERKAIASLKWDTAKSWDSKYKNKEFDTISKYIIWKEIF